MEQFEEKIRKWAEKFGMTLSPDYVPSAGFEHEIDESLHLCLFDTDHESGLSPPMPGVMAGEEVYEMEFGTSPDDYYPGCVWDVLNLVKQYDAQSTWQLEDVSSGDDWQTAQVTLKNKEGRFVSLTINGVNSSDWISGDFFNKMQSFTAEHCSLTVIVIYVDAFYRLIALPHEAAKELKKYIQDYSIPYG